MEKRPIGTHARTRGTGKAISSTDRAADPAVDRCLRSAQYDGRGVVSRRPDDLVDEFPGANLGERHRHGTTIAARCTRPVRNSASAGSRHLPPGHAERLPLAHLVPEAERAIVVRMRHDDRAAQRADVNCRAVGIGCRGATEPKARIGSIALRPVASPYADTDFAHDITNVDASGLYSHGGLAEGAHSDFWREETLHLIASIAEQVR
jgi:hypothetical protein